MIEKGKLKFISILEVDSQIQEKVRVLRNQENIRKYMYTDHVISEKEHKCWISSLKGNTNDLVMVVKIEEKFIGVAYFNNIDQRNRKADWGFYIKKEFQGKGMGSLIEYNMLDIAFEKMGLEKLNCAVLETNQSVIKLHKKFGFEPEGVLRKNILRDNSRIDVYLLGILNSEWKQEKEKLEKVILRILRQIHSE